MIGSSLHHGVLASGRPCRQPRVTHRHKHKPRGQDQSDHRFATHRGPSRGEVAGVAHEGPAVERDVGDGSHHEDQRQAVVRGHPAVPLGGQRLELVKKVPIAVRRAATMCTVFMMSFML